MENKQLATDKIICHECGEKGHNSKGCEAKVKCSICTKDTHIAEFCAWLHQKKPVASLMGFGGEGLGIFVADHAKELPGNNKNNAVALVRLRDGCDLEIDSDDLIKSLAKTYPWRWDWKAKKVSDGVFLVNFPSVARINEASIYDWVPLKGGNIMVKENLE